MSVQGELNFEQDGQLGGFRLHRFELLNWGTFDRNVKVMPLNGRNCLLTGDNGSGKSTLMDAVTTLLIPPAKLLYNKAAGVETRERTLRSYVDGYYKSERSAESLAARPVALRSTDSYSVLLGWFHNDSLGCDLTLAQVFWTSEGHSQPDRFYAAAERELSIVKDFSNFGRDMKGLRRKLREAGVELFDNYPPYAGYFSRILGIRSSQALDLFNQTVSMKTIGDLTDFVRLHMLERFDAAQRVQELIRHFDDLTGAHDAVVKARKQIEMLTPIEESCQEYWAKKTESDECGEAAAAVDCWTAGFKIALMGKKLRALSETAELQHGKITALDQEKQEKEQLRSELEADIGRNGGDRLKSVERDIERKESEKQRKKRLAGQYNLSAEALGLPACDSAAYFTANLQKVRELKQQLEDRRAQLQNDLMEAGAARKAVEDELEKLRQELQSLRSRRTNIESRVVALRKRLTDALGMDEDEIPFAGELIEVRQEEKAWEGAAERLLRNFGLSLLVPDKYYKKISDWVDSSDLRGRLVYFRVRETAAGRPPVLAANSLISKLALKEDSPLYHWLLGELSARFDFACCGSMDEFRREPRAVTQNGQIKTGDKRHEKDDRFSITDRSRYILGWNNREKIALLVREETVLAKEAARHAARLKVIAGDLNGLDAKGAEAAKLEYTRDFSELDWKKAAQEEEELILEHKALQAASKQLAVLTKRFEALKEELLKLDAKRDEAVRKETAAECEAAALESNIQQEKALASAEEVKRHEPSFPRLAFLHSESYGQTPLTLENADKRRRELNSRLAEMKKAADEEGEKLASRTAAGMSAFHAANPVETQEFTTDMAGAGDYLHLLSQLRKDDLPRFEAKFRKMLKEKTIQEIASFHENLNKNGREIEDKIATINEALVQIEYESGRYIRLEAEREKDMVIRQFQSDLRECTKDFLGAAGGDGLEEQRFANIEKIILHFKGRPEHASEDKKWTEKVTDVRNWYSFAASERWREDDTEYEHYSDSSGKSGGQKEKLAYTILAASLAYQFGLSADGSTPPRTFRFVMIDEAFGRGSDESAQFALALFQKLNLQLLVATPLQKIQVIEPFVSNVTFVSNKNGCDSALSNLTIEEYMEKKRAFDEMDDQKRPDGTAE